MKDANNFTELMDRFLAGSLTNEEHARLQLMVGDDAYKTELSAYIKTSFYQSATTEENSEWTARFNNKLLNRIRNTSNKRKTFLLSLRKWSVAAIVFVLLGLGVYKWMHHSSPAKQTTKQQVATIAPGSNKAVWILGDGKQVELDSTVLDMTAKKEQLGNVGYNELRTPGGGQYQLILPDGSRVWLNAASSIRFPVVFGKERRVEVNGEVYFEVVKDATKPFKVNDGEQEIEVLGTSFNVHTYDDDPFKASLAAGAIKINQTVLKPGQAYQQGRLITTNIEQDLAWKNGLFNLENTTLAQAMKQFARWYNIEVVYDNGIPNEILSGEMDRNLSLQDVLKGLEGIVAHFTLTGRTVHVRPL